MANTIATTKAYAEKINHDVCQPAALAITSLCDSTKLFTTTCAANVPIVAPMPFVININSPCAEDLMHGSVSLSTNNEPLMLKKSNATP